MGIFGINWKTKDNSNADQVIHRIRKMNDQKKLKEIALFAPLESVRKAAVASITDEKILKEIFIKHLHEEIQYEALEKITDDNLLTEIILNANVLPLELKNRAIAKMKDVNVIDRLSKEFQPTHRLYGDLSTKISILNKTPLTDGKDFLESILRAGDENTTLIRTVGIKLDPDDPLLDKEACPKCGAIESMHLFDEYRRSIDMNVRGYYCDKCKYESLEQNGLGELKSYRMTLREFIYPNGAKNK